VINSGGVKISPEVAERKLAHHIRFPFFLHGIPDEVLGQKLIMVVEASEVQAKDVEQQLAACDSLEKFEVPKTLFCVSEILRNNGKYLRAKTVDTLTIT
jgi:O-succinylbenzoic acid--CoA ligase